MCDERKFKRKHVSIKILQFASHFLKKELNILKCFVLRPMSLFDNHVIRL